jgi:hypothetical protein
MGSKFPIPHYHTEFNLNSIFDEKYENPVISITNQQSPILTSPAAHAPSSKKRTDTTELEFLPTACLSVWLSFML